MNPLTYCGCNPNQVSHSPGCVGIGMPFYIHTGLILNDAGKKMSKRNRADVVRNEIKRRIVEGTLSQKDKQALAQIIDNGLRE